MCLSGVGADLLAHDHSSEGESDESGFVEHFDFAGGLDPLTLSKPIQL